MDAIFISDLHLDDSRPDRTDAFREFCQVWGRGTRQLFILGDLFEVWIGDDHETRTADAVRTALAGLAAGGTRVTFMPGNRDFLLGDDFAARARLQLSEPPSTLTLGALKVVMTHGDELCTRDLDYQQFRKMVRDPHWIRAFKQRPLNVRAQMAAGIRKDSISKQKALDLSATDATEDAVQAVFESSDARVLIHGHTHRQGIHSHTVRGSSRTRVVLGEWTDTGWMATVEGAACHLLSFPVRQPQQVRRYGT